MDSDGLCTKANIFIGIFFFSLSLLIYGEASTGAQASSEAIAREDGV